MAILKRIMFVNLSEIRKCSNDKTSFELQKVCLAVTIQVLSYMKVPEW